VGALTALPVLLLALAAVPGSLLVSRVGARRALLLGLTVIAIAGAIRGVGSSAPLLFAATLAMGCGIAVCQPSLPSLVRAWLPSKIGLATATFSNGMLVGEIIPVAVTAGLLATLTNRWQPALAVWSVPVALTAAAIFVFSTNEPRASGLPRPPWWPDWRDGRVWQLGLTLGGASAAYWGANAFLPELLRYGHHSVFITPALTSLNLAQLPASFAIAARPSRLVARSWPLVASGGTTILATLGIIILPPVWLVVDVGFLGLATASVFVLTLALPPLFAQPGDTHRLSAAMFTISYVCPFLGSLLSGGLWDLTGVPQSAFIALILGGLMMMFFPTRLRLGHELLIPPDVAAESIIPA